MMDRPWRDVPEEGGAVKVKEAEENTTTLSYLSKKSQACTSKKSKRTIFYLINRKKYTGLTYCLEAQRDQMLVNL